MQLAIFDLDNTLLRGDSDHAWGEFLISKQVVDATTHRQKNDQFYADYRAGILDIEKFFQFSLKPMTATPLPTLLEWRKEFMVSHIEPLILPRAEALLAKHRAQGHTLLIITATNSFITTPIAERLAVPNLLATEPELKDNRFTGKITGTPCFREGKVTRLNEWLKAKQLQADKLWFYSDSINDLPLLQQVDFPIVVDGDEPLCEYARQQGWPQISLRK